MAHISVYLSFSDADAARETLEEVRVRLQAILDFPQEQFRRAQESRLDELRREVAALDFDDLIEIPAAGLDANYVDVSVGGDTIRVFVQPGAEASELERDALLALIDAQLEAVRGEPLRPLEYHFDDRHPEDSFYVITDGLALVGEVEEYLVSQHMWKASNQATAEAYVRGVLKDVNDALGARGFDQDKAQAALASVVEKLQDGRLFDAFDAVTRTRGNAYSQQVTGLDLGREYHGGLSSIHESFEMPGYELFMEFPKLQAHHARGLNRTRSSDGDAVIEMLRLLKEATMYPLGYNPVLFEHDGEPLTLKAAIAMVERYIAQQDKQLISRTEDIAQFRAAFSGVTAANMNAANLMGVLAGVAEYIADEYPRLGDNVPDDPGLTDQIQKYITARNRLDARSTFRPRVTPTRPGASSAAPANPQGFVDKIHAVDLPESLKTLYNEYQSLTLQGENLTRAELMGAAVVFDTCNVGGALNGADIMGRLDLDSRAYQFDISPRDGAAIGPEAVGRVVAIMVQAAELPEPTNIQVVRRPDGAVRLSIPVDAFTAIEHSVNRTLSAARRDELRQEIGADPEQTGFNPIRSIRNAMRQRGDRRALERLGITEEEYTRIHRRGEIAQACVVTIDNQGTLTNAQIKELQGLMGLIEQHIGLNHLTPEQRTMIVRINEALDEFLQSPTVERIDNLFEAIAGRHFDSGRVHNQQMMMMATAGMGGAAPVAAIDAIEQRERAGNMQTANNSMAQVLGTLRMIAAERGLNDQLAAIENVIERFEQGRDFEVPPVQELPQNIRRFMGENIALDSGEQLLGNKGKVTVNYGGQSGDGIRLWPTQRQAFNDLVEHWIVKDGVSDVALNMGRTGVIGRDRVITVKPLSTETQAEFHKAIHKERGADHTKYPKILDKMLSGFNVETLMRQQQITIDPDTLEVRIELSNQEYHRLLRTEMGQDYVNPEVGRTPILGFANARRRDLATALGDLAGSPTAQGTGALGTIAATTVLTGNPVLGVVASGGSWLMEQTLGQREPGRMLRRAANILPGVNINLDERRSMDELLADAARNETHMYDQDVSIHSPHDNNLIGLMKRFRGQENRVSDDNLFVEEAGQRLIDVAALQAAWRGNGGPGHDS